MCFACGASKFNPEIKNVQDVAQLPMVYLWKDSITRGVQGRVLCAFGFWGSGSQAA